MGGNAARARQDLQSSPHYKQYTSLSTDKDLVVDGAGYGACRQIKWGTTGDLVVTRPDGTNVTLTGRAVGETEEIQAIAIVASGTTATNVTVYW